MIRRVQNFYSWQMFITQSSSFIKNKQTKKTHRKQNKTKTQSKTKSLAKQRTHTCKWIRKQVSQVVSCYFESSQPQRIASGLKCDSSLSPNYSAHKSLNHKKMFNLFKICVYTNMGRKNKTKQKTACTNIKCKLFEKASPFDIAPVVKKNKKKIKKNEARARQHEG